NDGMLITQRQEDVAQVDAETAKKAILVQRIIHQLHLVDQRGGDPCKARDLVLAEAGQTAFGAAVWMEAGHGLAVSNLLNRLIECGTQGVMSGGGFLPVVGRYGLKNGQMTYRGMKPKEEEVA